MKAEEVQKKIEEAKQLVGGDPDDPLTRIAFEVVFRKLLDEREVDKVPRAAPPAIPDMEISEILASKNLKSHLDRVEAIAWHFLRRGEDSVTRQEIVDAYTKARTKRPKNVHDVLADSTRRGHLIYSPEKKEGQKAWCITHTGERYVEETLLSEAKQ